MEQDIIKRLKEILDYFKIVPSKLADEISINRSRLSHILNGRNNLTLEVVQGILNKYNEISPDWLLFGQGAMIRPGIAADPKDLFQYAEMNKRKKLAVVERDKPEESTVPEKESQTPFVTKEDISIKKTESTSGKAIKRITVYFSNNEYQDFRSE
jgi:transcriptional regulator with XRE-family HTH domain